MSKRLAEFTRSLRQLGDVRVNDWDLMGWMNTDLKDLEIGRSLRRLGNLKVIDWDFRTAMPAVHRFAHQEVHLADWVRRAAHPEVLDWHFGDGAPQDGTEQEAGDAPEESVPPPAGEERPVVIARLKGFLEFAIACLVDEPGAVGIQVEEIAPAVIRFRVVVSQRDVKDLIGRGGATAGSIRNLLKAKAESEGFHALLELASLEEEARAR